MNKQKIFKAEFDIIEHTAMKFAATFYEGCRNRDLKPRNPKHNTPRLWALHNFERFIPKAIETLIDMLSRNDIAEPMKEKIYLAIQERTNDKELQKLFPIDTLPDIDISKLIDTKPLPPIIVNTKRVGHG
jgi:hypothetical protein